MEDRQDVIDQVKEFNRFYTAQIGLLNQDFLASGYSVAETRIMFEIHRNRGISARELTDMLQLDKGYVSRIIRSFEQRGFVARRASSADGRTRLIDLTEEGKAEIDRLIAITNRSIQDLLAPLSDEDCQAMCDSMGAIIKIMGDS